MPRTPALPSGHPGPGRPSVPEGGSALRIGAPAASRALTHPAHSTDAPLPHERDQAVGQVAAEPDPVMLQALHDIEAGLVDTDMRATPGLDAARRGRLVPDTAPHGAVRQPEAVAPPTPRRRKR